jgi:hypothetical protein
MTGGALEYGSNVSDLHKSYVTPLKLCHDLCTLGHCAQVLLMHSLVKAGDHYLLQQSSVGF